MTGLPDWNGVSPSIVKLGNPEDGFMISCELCGKRLESRSTWREHFESKRHRANARAKGLTPAGFKLIDRKDRDLGVSAVLPEPASPPPPPPPPAAAAAATGTSPTTATGGSAAGVPAPRSRRSPSDTGGGEFDVVKAITSQLAGRTKGAPASASKAVPEPAASHHQPAGAAGAANSKASMVASKTTPAAAASSKGAPPPPAYGTASAPKPASQKAPVTQPGSFLKAATAGANSGKAGAVSSPESAKPQPQASKHDTAADRSTKPSREPPAASAPPKSEAPSAASVVIFTEGVKNVNKVAAAAGAVPAPAATGAATTTTSPAVPAGGAPVTAAAAAAGVVPPPGSGAAAAILPRSSTLLPSNTAAPSTAAAVAKAAAASSTRSSAASPQPPAVVDPGFDRFRARDLLWLSKPIVEVTEAVAVAAAETPAASSCGPATYDVLVTVPLSLYRILETRPDAASAAHVPTAAEAGLALYGDTHATAAKLRVAFEALEKEVPLEYDREGQFVTLKPKHSVPLVTARLLESFFNAAVCFAPYTDPIVPRAVEAARNASTSTARVDAASFW